MPRTLKDRAVLVTGASRGIGREIAIRAAAEAVRGRPGRAAAPTPIGPCPHRQRISPIEFEPVLGGRARRPHRWQIRRKSAHARLDAEFKSIPIAVNSLWPATTVASTGMLVAMGDGIRAQARDPRIMADAMHALITRPPDCSGHFYTDEQVLAEEGVRDFSGYLLAPTEDDVVPNFYLPSSPLPTVPRSRDIS